VEQDQAQSSNSEARNPKEIRRPKPEGGQFSDSSRISGVSHSRDPALWKADWLGFRISGFDFRVSLTPSDLIQT